MSIKRLSALACGPPTVEVPAAEAFGVITGIDIAETLFAGFSSNVRFSPHFRHSWYGKERTSGGRGRARAVPPRRIAQLPGMNPPRRSTGNGAEQSELHPSMQPPPWRAAALRVWR